MGVEYAHGLFVSDLSFRPTWTHVERAHDVLVEWGLARALPTLADVGEAPRVLQWTDAAARMPANLKATYDGAWGEAVARVMGPSQYGEKDASRYVERITMTVGVDFRVLRCESYPVRVEVPPIEADDFVEPDDFSDDDGFQLYRATWASSPPTTKTRGRFDGVFRCAIVLDCGKDLPAIAEACLDPLPAKAFRVALEEALGAKLIEQGWIH